MSRNLLTATRSIASPFRGTRTLSTLPVNPQKLDGWASKQHLGIAPSVEKMNAPTTLPVTIDLARPEGTSTGRHMLNSGKQIVKLYKSGIVNVWKNYWAGRQLMKKYGISTVGMLNQHVLDTAFAQGIEKQKSSNKIISPSERHISRAGYQMLVRTRRDFAKLPLFAVVFAVFFETTPLLVLAFPRLTPTTCTLPYHQRKHSDRLHNRILALKEKDTGNSAAASDRTKSFSRSVYQLERTELDALATALLQYHLVPVSLLPRAILERRVQAQIDVIRADDVLISRFGSVAALDPEEVRLACLTRAIPVKGKSDTQLKADLFLWMTNFAEGRYDAGFFFYPLETTQEQAGVVAKRIKHS